MSRAPPAVAGAHAARRCGLPKGCFNQSAGSVIDALAIADQVESGVAVRRYLEVYVFAVAAQTIGQQDGFPELSDMEQMDEVVALGEQLLDAVMQNHPPEGARITPAMIAWLRVGMTRVALPEAEQIEALLRRIEARLSRLSED